jgi:hypothetical protein
MSRLRLVVCLSVAVSASAGPASAAEVTRMSTAGEPDNAFDLKVSVRWDRTAETAAITRERVLDATESPPFGRVQNAPQLRYTRTSNVIVPRVAFGVYEDVEVHLEVPYVLADDRKYEFAKVNGVPVDVAYDDDLSDNTLDVENQPCAGTCPLFPVPNTVYHGGKIGDVVAGVAWGILNDEKDDTTASWVVGVDVTFPSAERYDPAKDRLASNWLSPFSVPAKPGPLGEKIWKYDFYTALSRRLGKVDPYVRAHVTATRPSSGTYSNCDSATALSTNDPQQMTTAGAQNCADPTWKDGAGARLPWMAGAVVGIEVVPYENPAKAQKVTLDLHGWMDYTSDARFYNALTDATGKLMFTEEHYTAGAQLGLFLRASRYVKLDATASYSKVSDHLLSGESLGRSGVLVGSGGPPDLTGQTPNADLNPNYDWRWDAAGRRFRLTDAGVFAVSFAFALTF